jgi:predicted RNA-binding Zn-ribbon protein involved in translation (DUF1610 family)
MANQVSTIGDKTPTIITKSQSVHVTEDPLSAAARCAEDRNAKALMRTSPPPTCLSCGYDLTTIARTPTFFRESYEDIDYKCEKCGAQEQRRIKKI